MNLLFPMHCATELTNVYRAGSVSLSVCSLVYLLTAVLRLNEGIVPRLTSTLPPNYTPSTQVCRFTQAWFCFNHFVT